ncbi:MAG: uracil-DNA glycosylase [Anaerolineales bacterium]|nr:uracil-DNA glycosylase [Anaerolineales bacterium]
MPTKFEQLNRQIISCRKCPRLVAWREEVARVKRKAYKNEEYWGKPVPGFGDPQARILVVGLAPGAHGSNRTGRQFTGDASGAFLFPALHKAGFANQAQAESRSDGLLLKDMYITASGRCAPPANKPTSEELDNCQPYLEREIEILKPKVIVCLGRIAFERVLKIIARLLTAGNGQQSTAGLPGSFRFAHGAVYDVPPSSFIPHPLSLLCSYHPSRQNTSTGKLTAEMFDDIWKKAGKLIEDG